MNATETQVHVLDALKEASGVSQRDGSWATVSEVKAFAEEHMLKPTQVTPANLNDLVANGLAEAKPASPNALSMYRVVEAGSGGGSSKAKGKGHRIERPNGRRQGGKPGGGRRSGEKPSSKNNWGKPEEISNAGILAAGAAEGVVSSTASSMAAGQASNVSQELARKLLM